jgi:hypothetical protein
MKFPKQGIKKKEEQKFFENIEDSKKVTNVPRN